MFVDSLIKLWEDSGFASLTWQSIVMLIIACILLYMAIGKKFEPLLLLPIAFGMLLANLPMTDLMSAPPSDTEAGGLLYYLYLGVKKRHLSFPYFPGRRSYD